MYVFSQEFRDILNLWFYRFTNNAHECLLPPANEVWGKVIFLHLSVILFTGGGTWACTPPTAGTPPGQVPPWVGTPPGQVHPPGRYTPNPPAGTPPCRYTPAGTLPPLQAGTPQQVPPWQVPPGGYTTRAGTPPSRYTPLGRYTPGNACWDTVNKRAVRILVYLNAILSQMTVIYQDSLTCFKGQRYSSLSQE